jgi:hypothetical protein
MRKNYTDLFSIALWRINSRLFIHSFIHMHVFTLQDANVFDSSGGANHAHEGAGSGESDDENDSDADMDDSDDDTGPSGHQQHSLSSAQANLANRNNFYADL